MDKKVVEEYLDEKGCTLWGRSFDIISKDSREDAIQFIMELWWDLDAIRLSQMYDSTHDPIPYA